MSKGVGEILEFPPDVAGEGPRISIIGRDTVLVEHYQFIMAFSEDQVSLMTRVGVLHIEGKNFVLNTMLPTEIHLSGVLISLRFAQEGGEGND
jgi:sporulation protein YqfC